LLSQDKSLQSKRRHKRVVFYEKTLRTKYATAMEETTVKEIFSFQYATAEEMIVPRMVAGKICASAVKIPRMTRMAKEL
jgi:hypothetical protein